MSALEPWAALVAEIERLALPDLEADALRALPGWLSDDAPRQPIHRLNDGFRLDEPAASLIALLAAAALSPPLANALQAVSPGAGGVPFWLAARLIPGLGPERLALSGTLRQFELVVVQEGASRVEARLTLPDAVLDRLCGRASADAAMQSYMLPVPQRPDFSDTARARTIHAHLQDRAEGLPPVLIAPGVEPSALAADLAALGLTPHLLDAASIPADPPSRARLARLWTRDSALDGAALIIRSEDNPAEAQAIVDFVDRVLGIVIVAGRLGQAMLLRPARLIEEQASTLARTADRWGQALGTERRRKLGDRLLRIANQFRLPPAEIDSLCEGAAPLIDQADSIEEAERRLWHAAARLPAPTVLSGVKLIEPVFGWQDIILPAGVERHLRRVEAHFRHATKVFEEWGFAARMGGRGRGIAALFSGPSGTGKTMAAEVLASALDLRLMIVDLSQIISKWVGETPKNVAAAFALAERTGAVMLWNEGDAIWGARGAVVNATDRHANAEVGDLLQRIESFNGFTIVTTNLPHAIDPAFLRRFRFTIDFPLPSETERLAMWRRAFPADAPIGPINWSALAALPLSGGSIRNVALGSAFLAADAGRPIDHDCIAMELREELRKSDQPMPAIDWGVVQ